MFRPIRFAPIASRRREALESLAGVTGRATPPRTHVLMLLADQLAASFPTVEQLGDDLAILTPYAVAARYPDDDFDMPTIEDAREARQCAERVLTWAQTTYPDLTNDDS